MIKKPLRFIPIGSSGPFHTRELESAEKMLKKDLNYMEKHGQLRDLDIPIVTNFRARITEKKEEAKADLMRQMTNRIRWQPSLETLLAAMGKDALFVEVGTGHILEKMLTDKRLDKPYKVVHWTELL